jgi:hypothetical protein
MRRTGWHREHDRIGGVALGFISALFVGTAILAIAACANHSSAAPAAAGNAETSTGEAAIDTDATPIDDDSALDASLDTALDAASEACHPGSVSGFQPAVFVPSHPSHVCNGFNGEGGLVEGYGRACIGHTKSFDACAAFAAPDAAAAAACYNCLTSPERADASSYGAVVVVGIPFVNYSGCIQVVDPEAGTSCSQALTAAATCNKYACRSTCSTAEYPSFDTFQGCWDEATSGACAGYWFTVQSCVAAEQGDGGTPVGRTCFPGTVEDNYWSVARLLCGGD